MSRYSKAQRSNKNGSSFTIEIPPQPNADRRRQRGKGCGDDIRVVENVDKSATFFTLSRVRFRVGSIKVASVEDQRTSERLVKFIFCQICQNLV